MNLFNFFHKYKLPESYKPLVSQQDYNKIINIIKKYHTDNNLKITKIGEGEIVVVVDEEERHAYLDNLVRVLSINDKTLWQRLIYEHFDKSKDHSSAYNYLFKDFEYASQFLRVLIKSDELFQDIIQDYVHRVDFPSTNTFLVLEYEQQFRYLTYKDIEEWDKPHAELFDIAIANIPREEIQVKEYQYSERFNVLVFISGDYSAALMLDMPVSAGAYGNLVAIPTKGTAFVHRIDSTDIMDLVAELAPTVGQFYNEDPGSITTNFYWLYEDRVEVFPVKEDENGFYVSLPADLQEAFSK